MFWPRGSPKRVEAGKAEKTSILRLEWTVAEWDGAPAALIGALARHAREGLPRRYGDFEPFEHDFEPAALATFAREHETFWLASRPFFGGHAFPPARLGVSVDLRIVRADTRWREAIVDLFAAVAAATGATAGEAYPERGWHVSANNRLSAATTRRGPALLTWDGALRRHGDQPLSSRWRSWLKPG